MYSFKFKWKFLFILFDVCNNKFEIIDLDYGEKYEFFELI